MGTGGHKAFSFMSLVRWKAMKLDREEAKEEVYMPTDKVFVWHCYHGISFCCTCQVYLSGSQTSKWTVSVTGVL